MANTAYHEVVVSSSESHSKGYNCCVWDPSTGSHLSYFKDGVSSPKNLRLIGKDYIVAALSGVPLLKFWTWNKKDRIEHKFTLPGIVTGLAISPKANYCVAAIGKRLFVWQLTTGNLVSIVEFHYQEVNCIRFTDDGWYFVTGGRDTIVAVWELNEVLAHGHGLSKGVVKPLYSWNNHSDSVTDIYVGHGGLKARVATSSNDMTCQVYDLSSGKLIFSVYTDIKLRSVILDPAEIYMYIGTESGSICQIKWYSCLNDNSLTLLEKQKSEFFNAHSAPVICLSASIDGKHFLSGSMDGLVKIWETLSKVNLFTFDHSAPVTNAFFTLAPSALKSQEKVLPNTVLKPFKRVQGSEPNQPIEMIIQSRQPTTFDIEACDSLFNNAASKGLSLMGAQSKAELQRDLIHVQESNLQLYSFSMSSFLHTMKDFKVFDE